ncbi:hypothetical protein QT711_04280 [Sporosarcina saromensis]|uniref:PilX N-terminal n=1 Tax=Sporosarcina saromensis TaxID=359365 RepID=A0ABU4G7U7_9BACL|nr:hypothetical protein [Sporosarcina saromensis]MDW0112390.1 hypothetical protein [Sporosarcina saromensis]
MKRTTNEQGYALLLVLFLIFFILLASAVFIKGSISNAKQEKKVDMNHLSVVAAEMGVDYYQNKYKNVFFKEKKDVWNHLYEQFTIDKQEIMSKKISEVRKIEEIRAKSNEYEREVAISLKKKLEGLENFILDEGEELNSRIVNSRDSKITFSDLKLLDNQGVRVQSINNNNNLTYYLVIEGEIEGNYKGEESFLNLNLIFYIPDMFVEQGTELPSNINILENPLSFIERPKVNCDKSITNSPCVGTSKTQLESANNSQIYFVGNKNWNGAISHHFNNSEIYVDGNIENIMLKGATGIKIYSKGEFYLKQGEPLSNSIIVTDSNLITDKLNRLESSKLFVKGNLIYTNKLNIFKSTVYVGDDLEVSGNGNTDVKFNNSNVYINDNFKHPKGKTIISGNSRVCVGNDFIYGSKGLEIETGSKLFITKNIITNGTINSYINDKRIEKVTKDELKYLCNSTPNEQNWEYDLDVNY